MKGERIQELEITLDRGLLCNYLIQAKTEFYASNPFLHVLETDLS